MRTIKFRGKDIESGQWAIGDLHTLCDKPHIHTEHTSFPFAGKRSFVNPDTIGQFTGLHDKNGKEIYEGDIIRFVNGQKKVNGEWVDNEFIYTIEYSEGAFRGVLGLSKSLDAVEVIGNIHDTPELLENK